MKLRVLAWRALAVVALLTPTLGFVLPGEKVVAELTLRRESIPAVRVEVGLSGVDRLWPTSIVVELHPELGFRVTDGSGGRWVVRRGRAVASTGQSVPAWIPDLEILSLRLAEDLSDWFERTGVNPEWNELGRCGEADCFVLGGRQATGQLWVDKDRFEIRRWLFGGGRSIEFDSYRNWADLRFPGEIRVVSRTGVFAVLTVQAVEPAPGLSEADFSSDWVDSEVNQPQP